jgi:uncharacterized caspase-like protein
MLTEEAITKRRIALVIGNSSYAHEGYLPNPKNDAADIASALKRLNFAVRVGIDLSREKLVNAIADFARDMASADTALFFYAGHGLQVDGRNYLVPIDAEIAQESDVAFRAQPLDPILQTMMGATNASFIILDACRNNPFTRALKRSMSVSRSTAVGEGLAVVRPRPDGEALIAYSTQPDNTAADGQGRNSPYTDALLRHIELPGVTIEELLRRVTRVVRDATNRQQIPWYTSSLTQSFEFLPMASGEKVEGRAEHPWMMLKGTDNPKLIRSFIDNFPADVYVGEAKRRLGELEAGAWDAIRNQQTITNLETFLVNYPDGQRANVATQKLVMQRRYFVASFIAFGLLTGVISSTEVTSSLQTNTGFLHHFMILIDTGQIPPIALWWNTGVFLFACAVIFGLWWWRSFRWQKLFILFVVTMLGWVLAHLSYQGMAKLAHLQLTELTRLSAGDMPAEAQPLKTNYETLMLGLIAGVACLIGAALTILGVPAPGQLRRLNQRVWCILGSALAAVSMIILGTGDSQQAGLMALFVTWQMWVAGCIAWNAR